MRENGREEGAQAFTDALTGLMSRIRLTCAGPARPFAATSRHFHAQEHPTRTQMQTDRKPNEIHWKKKDKTAKPHKLRDAGQT